MTIMKSERKNSILKGVVLSGMMAGALPLAANAENLMNYELMGSGSEIRSDLLNQYGSPIEAVSNVQNDYVVGEAKCGEAKCGEGKCGSDSKKEAKKSEAKSTKADKTSEATCGEKSKKEKGKTTEAKCGENTCGGAE
jgi:uncharacterized low-complexity protein